MGKRKGGFAERNEDQFGGFGGQDRDNQHQFSQKSRGGGGTGGSQVRTRRACSSTFRAPPLRFAATLSQPSLLRICTPQPPRQHASLCLSRVPADASQRRGPQLSASRSQVPTAVLASLRRQEGTCAPAPSPACPHQSPHTIATFAMHLPAPCCDIQDGPCAVIPSMLCFASVCVRVCVYVCNVICITGWW